MLLTIQVANSLLKELVVLISASFSMVDITWNPKTTELTTATPTTHVLPLTTWLLENLLEVSTSAWSRLQVRVSHHKINWSRLSSLRPSKELVFHPKSLSTTRLTWLENTIWSRKRKETGLWVISDTTLLATVWLLILTQNTAEHLSLIYLFERVRLINLTEWIQLCSCNNLQPTLAWL